MTKKEKTILNMSFIPIILLIALILGGGYFLFKGEIKLPKFNKGPQVRRLQGFPTTVGVDKVLTKQRLVIKSQEELNNFLNSLDPSGLLTMKDTVNFSKEYLIAVVSPTYEEDGHTIKIKKMYEDKEKKEYNITFEETEKGKDCEVQREKNITVDMVAVSKTDWAFKFTRLKKTLDCNTESSGSSESSATTDN